MSNEPAHWYPSKVDWWLAPLLSLPPVAGVAVTVALALANKPGEMLIGAGGLGFVAAIYLGLVFPMRYGLTESHLIVRFGLCRSRIPLSDITDVHPTRNPLSSPALSLDRLHVQYGESCFKAVMISPADRDRFLNELAARTGLTREGDRVVRQSDKYEKVACCGLLAGRGRLHSE